MGILRVKYSLEEVYGQNIENKRDDWRTEKFVLYVYLNDSGLEVVNMTFFF
jgi:hypothetical protein